MKKLLFFSCLLFALPSFAQTKKTVAQDGSGNFKTVQEAFNIDTLKNVFGNWNPEQ